MAQVLDPFNKFRVDPERQRRRIDGIQSHQHFEPTELSGGRSQAVRRFWLALVVFSIGVAGLGVTVASDVAEAWRLRQLLPPGHYLILLQNNAEQRPSGGFIGTFAVVDLVPTGYRHLSIDTNIYKRDNALTQRQLVEPPAPLRPITNGRWAMRDANWDPDFRDAAERVAWFYAQEGGEPVDGVIALNATVVQDLLRLTGPVKIPGSDDTLTTDNFFDTLHYKIEKEYFEDSANTRANEPKTVLKDLLPVLTRKLTQPIVAAQVLPLLLRELAEKHVLLYHRNPDVERNILTAGWGGAIEDVPAGVAIVNANVGGQKSSLNVRQDTDVAVTTTPATWHYELTLRRQHTGDGIWPDHANDNYLRLLVPPDAMLGTVTRNGVVVSDELVAESYRNRTSWGLSVNTPPGGESVIAVQYTRPASSDPFTLVYQKQPGTLAEELTVRFNGQTLFDGLVTKDTHVRE